MTSAGLRAGAGRGGKPHGTKPAPARWDFTAEVTQLQLWSSSESCKDRCGSFFPVSFQLSRERAASLVWEEQEHNHFQEVPSHDHLCFSVSPEIL